MKIKIINIVSSNKYFRYVLFAIVGFFLGWIFFHHPQKTEVSNQNTEQSERAIIWTCAMHPQIRMNHPGKCPICGMDLIPLNQGPSSTPTDPNAIQLTKEAAQLANVLTSTVTKQKPVKEVRLYGRVQADERLLQSQVSHMPGRIEKLLANFTGETVNKGQPLAIIYSPDLITAQQELLEAAKMKQSQPEIYEAAKDKLRQWKLTDNQISEIENSGKVTDNFEIYSNTDGVIISMRVNNGDHVDQGTVLFDVADLSDIWVMFDAYESDLPFLNNGDQLTFTVQALPGRNFTGTISFIDPVINSVTRVAKVRVEINNSARRLKPEMFASGIVKADLNKYADKLIIPRSSVLWTGTRSIVYVREPGSSEPVFRMREIELGPSLGNSYVVMSGLNDGDEIVTSGTYSIDASAQLEGKPSMMNPGGEKVATGHAGMEMPRMEPAGRQTAEKKETTPGMVTPGNSQSKVSMNFIMQLNDVYDKYIELKNALVDDNSVKAGEASKSLKEELGRVDMKLLGGDAHMKWMEILNGLNKEAASIISESKIDSQRSAFSVLSNLMYEAVRTFGLMGKTVYYQFCPMFNNGTGAYWLSEIKEIKNPYYGKKMIDCGEIRETLNF
ncbi:MAG: efflux RND transporter periplasmic adaptor subunit [Bacteroidota bacterium]|nr:efflux RND transporter periplasmic adaptor subunit [Bacteroidota bacterium]